MLLNFVPQDFPADSAQQNPTSSARAEIALFIELLSLAQSDHSLSTMESAPHLWNKADTGASLKKRYLGT